MQYIFEDYVFHKKFVIPRKHTEVAFEQFRLSPQYSVKQHYNTNQLNICQEINSSKFS